MSNQNAAAQTTTLTPDQMLALIAKLQADNAALAAQAAQPKRITLKVSEKGGLSLYGLGRFPVTLYRSQWERLMQADVQKQITEFIRVNSTLLTVKA